MTAQTTAEVRLQLLDALIEGAANIDSAVIDLGDGNRLHLHTTAQVVAWLTEERNIAAASTLDGLPAHRHPAWAAGVRWAADEMDAQADGRQPVWIDDIADHVRACADDPKRGAVMPRDGSPRKGR